MQAFGQSAQPVDVVLVDAVAGVASHVLPLSLAAQELVLVVDPQPASMTDAYALIKVLNQGYARRNFHIIVNRVASPEEGAAVFRNVAEVASRFLKVSLDFMGFVPPDEKLRRATSLGRSVVDAFPASPAAQTFRDLAEEIEQWPHPAGDQGQMEAFMQRLIQSSRAAAGESGRDGADLSGGTYQSNGKLQNHEQSVVQYAPLVKRIAHRLAAKLPSSVQVDDLIQAGLMGLLDAVNHYDQTQGAQFETYASQRIRGAMLDELREADWAPRSVRKSMRTIEAAINKLEQQLGRPPAEQEAGQGAESAAGWSTSRCCRMRVATSWCTTRIFRVRAKTIFLSVMGQTSAQIHWDRSRARIFARPWWRQSRYLPEREQLMMSLYYEEELNLKEIGAVLGVTESRVSQLHSQAVARLRSQLKEWLGH